MFSSWAFKAANKTKFRIIYKQLKWLDFILNDVPIATGDAPHKGGAAGGVPRARLCSMDTASNDP